MIRKLSIFILIFYILESIPKFLSFSLLNKCNNNEFYDLMRYDCQRCPVNEIPSTNSKHIKL